MSVSGISTSYNMSYGLEKKKGPETKGNSQVFDRRRYEEFIREKADEAEKKIINGDTEPAYAIGGRSFTEKEWKSLLENYDKAEEEIKKEIEERKEEKNQELKEAEKNKEQAEKLASEYTKCSIPDKSGNGEKEWYITMYTEDGIYCKKLGKIGEVQEYLWTIKLDDIQQYKKIMNFIEEYDKGGDWRFAANESFWREFLKGETETDKLIELFQTTDF